MSVPITFLLTAISAYAQAPASASASEPDVLVCKDGERLIGHLERATSSSAVFKSDVLGEVTIDWAKIQELHSSTKFAVIPKGVRLRNKEDETQIPQGTVTVTDQQLAVNTGAQPAPAPVSVANVANLVEEADFQRAFTHEGFSKGWNGGFTGGISLTEATQKDQTYTAGINLVRAVPSDNWLDVRSRTSIEFNAAYGKLSEPGTPAIKTSLDHFALEQDWYLKPRLFAFGEAILDHSFSQGLKLQQNYGGGLGFVVLKTSAQELDFKASANYIDQRFETPGLDQTLFGSTFGETYTRKFAHSILLAEQGAITPAWNNTSAYSAFINAALTLPVYHRFGLTVGALDNFLNDPPPGFNKNSFQLTIGATYSLR
jgi:hypothetical protein